MHSCSHDIFVAVMLYVCEWLSMKVSFHSVHRVDTTLMKYFLKKIYNKLEIHISAHSVSSIHEKITDPN